LLPKEIWRIKMVRLPGKLYILQVLWSVLTSYRAETTIKERSKMLDSLRNRCQTLLRAVDGDYNATHKADAEKYK
jgi:hypothetical protein